LRLTTITRPRHPSSDPPLFFFTLLKLSPPRPRSGGEHRVTDRERGARWPDHSQRGHPQAPQDPRGPPARRPQQTWRTAPEFIYLNSSSFTEAPLFLRGPVDHVVRFRRRPSRGWHRPQVARDRQPPGQTPAYP